MVLQQFLNGLALGSVYALIAVGFTMVFSVIEIINFSHGAIFMLGGFIGLTLMGLGFLPSLFLTMLATAIIGIIVEKITIFPLRKRKANRVILLVSTLGTLIALSGLAELIWSTDPKAYPPPFQIPFFELFGARISSLNLTIFGIGLLTMLLLHLFLSKLKVGKAIRAANQNAKAASLLGINIDRMISIIFAIGSAIGALGGILVGIYFGTIHPSVGVMAGLKGFIAAVLGGMGSVPGAAAGGIILGMAEIFGGGYISFEYQNAIAFIILVFILIFKPTGILGVGMSEKV